MLKKNLFGMITLLLGFILVFTLVSCRSDDDSLNPPPGSGGGGVPIDIPQGSIQYREIDSVDEIEPVPSLDGQGYPGYFVGDGCSYNYYFMKSKADEDLVRETFLHKIGFDESFIENNLVLIEIWDKSGGNKHELETISATNNELNIIINRYNIGDTTDIAYRFWIIPIKKENFNGNKINIDVIFHDSETEGDPIPDSTSIVEGNHFFNAKILEIKRNPYYVLVEPLEGEDILHIADQILFKTAHLGEAGFVVGDYITVQYTGIVLKTYPAGISAISWSVYCDIAP